MRIYHNLIIHDSSALASFKSSQLLRVEAFVVTKASGDCTINS